MVRAWTRTIGVLSVLALAAAWPSTSAAQQAQGIAVEADGSILVVRGNALIRVDPPTGVATVVSSATVGSGPSLVSARDVAVEAGGSLVVSDRGSRALLRVDSASGDRTILSDDTTGSGPPLGGVQSVAIEADGSLVVADRSVGGVQALAVVRVDPVSGDRTVVSDSTVGDGPMFFALAGIAVEANGHLVVTDQPESAVFRVEPVTGDRTIVSDKHGSPSPRGSGPALTNPTGLTVAPDGALLVAQHTAYYFCLGIVACVGGGGSVTRVDPSSGDRVRISGGGLFVETEAGGRVTPYLGNTGWGPMFREVDDVAVESEESLVVNYFIDDGTSGVMRIDAETGRRRIVTTFNDLAVIGDAQEGTASESFSEAVRRLEILDPSRVYRPADEKGWLRYALGDERGSLARRLLAGRLDGLSTAERRVLGERLFAALWRTMRNRLGDAHPVTQEGTYGMAALAARRGDRRQVVELLRRLSKAGRVPRDAAQAPDFWTLRRDPEVRALLRSRD